MPATGNAAARKFVRQWFDRLPPDRLKPHPNSPIARRLARSQQKEGANVEGQIDEERAEEAEEETLVVSIRRRVTRARPLGGLFFMQPRHSCVGSGFIAGLAFASSA
jgi:hypothetical protein